MADEHDVDLDTINQEEEEVLSDFDEATDKELEEAGDDPAKLKEIIKARTATRQRLYARMKKAEADAKANKPSDKAPQPKQQKGGKALTEFDYGQEAYLIAKGVEDDEARNFLLSEVNETGKSLREVMSFKYVQETLKDLKAEKETALATPKGDKIRGGKSAQNTVEYWIAKGELPPAEQVELRRKVVAEKIRQDSTGNKFGGR